MIPEWNRVKDKLNTKTLVAYTDCDAPKDLNSVQLLETQKNEQMIDLRECFVLLIGFRVEDGKIELFSNHGTSRKKKRKLDKEGEENEGDNSECKYQHYTRPCHFKNLTMMSEEEGFNEETSFLTLKADLKTNVDVKGHFVKNRGHKIFMEATLLLPICLAEHFQLVRREVGYKAIDLLNYRYEAESELPVVDELQKYIKKLHLGCSDFQVTRIEFSQEDISSKEYRKIVELITFLLKLEELDLSGVCPLKYTSFFDILLPNLYSKCYKLKRLALTGPPQIWANLNVCFSFLSQTPKKITFPNTVKNETFQCKQFIQKCKQRNWHLKIEFIEPQPKLNQKKTNFPAKTQKNGENYLSNGTDDFKRSQSTPYVSGLPHPLSFQDKPFKKLSQQKPETPFFASSEVFYLDFQNLDLNNTANGLMNAYNPNLGSNMPSNSASQASSTNSTVESPGFVNLKANSNPTVSDPPLSHEQANHTISPTIDSNTKTAPPFSSTITLLPLKEGEDEELFSDEYSPFYDPYSHQTNHLSLTNSSHQIPQFSIPSISSFEPLPNVLPNPSSFHSPSIPLTNQNYTQINFQPNHTHRNYSNNPTYPNHTHSNFQDSAAPFPFPPNQNQPQSSENNSMKASTSSPRSSLPSYSPMALFFLI